MTKLEQSSRAQFDRWADSYDRLYNWQHFTSNRALLSQISPISRSCILDIGCATGNLLAILSKKYPTLKLYGVDNSPKMVKLATNKLGSKATIKLASANQLPFPEKSFDVVTCATSFHHYSRPVTALKQMNRVLKPKGTLIILDPFSDGVIRKEIIKFLNLVFNESATRFYSKQKWQQMLHQSGFKSIKCQPYLYYKLMIRARKPVPSQL